MATISFKRPFVIKDDKAADALIEALERSPGTAGKRGDFDEQVKRGSEYIRRRYSR
jgi:hypothetical protein